MITDMISKKKLQPIVTELVICNKKLNTFVIFMKKSNFEV